jgi:glycosyltransferase involved in cell wall biosynthesis
MSEAGTMPTAVSSVSGRPKVILIGPVPPPAFGVAKATRLMLDSSVLNDRLRIVHLDTSDNRELTSMGRLERRNVYLGVLHLYRLLRLLVKERPSAVLLTISQGKYGIVRDGLFVSASRMFGVRTAAYLRGSGYAEIRKREGWTAARALRSILQHSARVFVLGESLRGMVYAICPDSRVAVVPNGCPPAVPADQVATRDESRPVLLYLGALTRAKGVDDALAAACEIARAVPSLEFVLAGEWASPGYAAETRRLVEASGLSKVVRFAGPATGEAKQALLARAWVLIVPSHSEGQPWVILEAMSAGLPVVATDTGAIAETVQHGVEGFVVPVGDTHALATGVTALLNDQDLWARTSRAAVRRYQEEFTLERSHSNLADELEQVAARG